MAFGLRPFFLVVAAPLFSIKLNTFLGQITPVAGSCIISIAGNGQGST
jgi:hypothetical protein